MGKINTRSTDSFSSSNTELEELKVVNEELIKELEQLRLENISLKKMYEENTEITLALHKKMDEELSTAFIPFLEILINQNYLSQLIKEDLLIYLVGVECDEEEKSARFSYLAHQASSQIDLVQSLSKDIIQSELAEDDPLYNKIMAEIESENDGNNRIFSSERVSSSVYGKEFNCNYIIFKNDNNRVLAALAIGKTESPKTAIPKAAEVKSSKDYSALMPLINELEEYTGDQLKETLEKQIIDLSEIISIINLHSRSVRDALLEIDAVADQTKILSFNATIESARAGVHGKGFAVVSGEIRKLADKSKKSIDNITKLILDIFTDIEKITDLHANLNSTLSQRQNRIDQRVKILSDIKKAIKS